MCTHTVGTQVITHISEKRFETHLPSGPKLGTKGDARRRAEASCDANDIDTTHSSTPLPWTVPRKRRKRDLRMDVHVVHVAVAPPKMDGLNERRLPIYLRVYRPQRISSSHCHKCVLESQSAVTFKKQPIFGIYLVLDGGGKGVSAGVSRVDETVKASVG